jgi:hypothetical protein
MEQYTFLPTQVKKYGSIPAGKHQKSMEHGSSIPAESARFPRPKSSTWECFILCIHPNTNVTPQNFYHHFII